ncbi:MAG: hypothetical protein WBP58_03485 [Chitinophagaceae bacterium]
MRNLMVAMALIAAAIGLMDCLGAVGQAAKTYCIGLIFILLGIMTTLYIIVIDSRFGEKPSTESIPEQNLQLTPLRR